MQKLFYHRFEISEKKPAYDVLLIFASTAGLDPEELATVIEGEIGNNLMPDEIFIVVRDVEYTAIRNQLINGEQNKSILNRIHKGSTVTIAGYDIKGKKTKCSQVKGATARYSVKFEDFKRRAITDIFNKRGGFIEATATYHFENPSGKHTNRFMRLSNLMVREAEMAFIAFCMLPFIPKNTSTAYIDTPSLYPLIASINEQRLSLGAVERIQSDNFSSYAGLSTYQFSQSSNSCFLISASTTGNLALKLVDEHGIDKNRIIHVLFLGDCPRPLNIVCDLRCDASKNPTGIAVSPIVVNPSVCPMCADGSHAIKLKGDQFEFGAPQPETILIRKIDAPTSLSRQMNDLAGSGLFCVGLGDAVKRQPRQFHIDAIALLKNKKFNEKLDYLLRRSLPAGIKYVIATDADSLPLAKIIANSNARHASVIRISEIDKIEKKTRSAIIITAAVIESGRSLLNISRDLRSIASDAPLLYLVGVSKTTGELRREGLEKTLTQTSLPFPYQFIEVEKLFLPRSLESHAWDSERKFLIYSKTSGLVPRHLEKFIDKRIDLLGKATSPLLNNLFMQNKFNSALELQPGFVFWPSEKSTQEHSQADVFFTIASVLQKLRSNARDGSASTIKSNLFQQTILAPENFGRFNDDIVQASILRAAHASEMNYCDSLSSSRELGRLICRVISSAGKERGGAAAEFLIALGTKRLRLHEDDLKKVLSEPVNNAPIVSFLQQACEAKLVS